MIFESELKNGKFVVGQCIKCRNTNWPPNNFCNNCFGDLTWRQIKEPGILIEWSSKNNQIFGIVEFENSIRVIGTITNDTNLKTGEKMTISNCGFSETPKFTFAPYFE
jgi:uncharacterized OB-fold protein